MLTIFALSLSTALASDYSNATSGDFDGDGEIDVAIGITDDACGTVEVWLSSLDPAWPPPPPEGRSLALPAASVVLRSSQCEGAWGALVDAEISKDSGRDLLLVFSKERDEFDAFDFDPGDPSFPQAAGRATGKRQHLPLTIVSELCDSCCGGGSCCIGGSCSP